MFIVVCSFFILFPFAATDATFFEPLLRSLLRTRARRGKRLSPQWLPVLPAGDLNADILALKHEGRILGQWSNPVSGSRKSQASCPWANQRKSLTCSIMEKPHTGLDECPRILLSCFRARNSVSAANEACMQNGPKMSKASSPCLSLTCCCLSVYGCYLR